MRKAKREKLVSEVRKNLVNAAIASGRDKVTTDTFVQGINATLEAVDAELTGDHAKSKGIYNRVIELLKRNTNSFYSQRLRNME